jgi:hypothetical protein
MYGLQEGKCSSDSHTRRSVSWKSAKICRGRVRAETLKYNTAARAFAFSTNLLSVHYLDTSNGIGRGRVKQNDRNLSFQYMDEAIEILRHGDLLCRVKAMSFSKKLSLWYKVFENGNKVNEEKGRTRELRFTVNTAPITMAEIQASVGAERGSSSNTRSRRKRRRLRDSLYINN